jgi:hypothetical protein
MYEYTEHQAPKKRKSKKGKALHGMSEEKKEALKQHAIGATKPLFIVAGLWLGNMGGKLIDKHLPPNPDGKFHFTELVKPLAQGTVGATIVWLSRSKKEDKDGLKTIKELAKNFGYGIAGSGIISGAKLLKSDLFEGLGNATPDAEKKPVEAKYYTEAKDEIMKMLQDNSFRPALPEGENISSLPDKEEMNGLGLNLRNHTEEGEAEIL